MINILYNRHKETAQNFFWRSLQMFSRYGVTAIIFFAAAKLLSPEDFGLLNYLRTVFFLLMIFCDFGLSYAVSKFVTEYKISQPEKLNRIAFTIVTFSVSIGALISVVVIVLGDTFFKENYRYILYFLPYLFLIPLTDILDGMYRGLKEFKKLAVISSIVGLVSIGISLFLINRYLLLGAIWSLNITNLLLFLSLCGFQKNFRFEFDKSVLVEVLKYALLLGIGTVAGFLYTRVSILILKQFGFITEIGYYGLLDSIFQLIFLPFGILGQVVAPNTTAYITVKNVAEIKSKVRKYAAFCVIAGLALSVSLYLGIPVVVKNIFPRYNTADFFLITNILLPLMPFYVWGAVLNQGFIVPAGMAKIYVAISLIGGILNVLLNYVFISLFGFVGVFWVMLGIHSGSTIIATVYFYIKMNALAQSCFYPPKVNLGDSGEQRA
ncbi:MAG: oligosaccharide flippase family protein [Sedimentisphaerales bacterium]|nr:oligosaccharide flippase family protein [Sedimentisphaerales bacterium]